MPATATLESAAAGPPATAALLVSRKYGAPALSSQATAVLVAPPGAGKTTALINSGLKFPLAGDTAAVAASTATAVRAALHLLFHDPAAAAAAAAERRRLGAPPPLFGWNSWARAGRTLRRAGFGCPGGPARFEWLNALESRDPTTVLVTGVAMPPALPQAPSAPGEALAVLVTCSGAEEEAAVDATWGPAARGGGGGGSPAA